MATMGTFSEPTSTTAPNAAEPESSQPNQVRSLLPTAKNQTKRTSASVNENPSNVAEPTLEEILREMGTHQLFCNFIESKGAKQEDKDCVYFYCKSCRSAEQSNPRLRRSQMLKLWETYLQPGKAEKPLGIQLDDSYLGSIFFALKPADEQLAPPPPRDLFAPVQAKIIEKLTPWFKKLVSVPSYKYIRLEGALKDKERKADFLFFAEELYREEYVLFYHAFQKFLSLKRPDALGRDVQAKFNRLASGMAVDIYNEFVRQKAEYKLRILSNKLQAQVRDSLNQTLASKETPKPTLYAEVYLLVMDFMRRELLPKFLLAEKQAAEESDPEDDEITTEFEDELGGFAIWELKTQKRRRSITEGELDLARNSLQTIATNSNALSALPSVQMFEKMSQEESPEMSARDMVDRKGDDSDTLLSTPGSTRSLKVLEDFDDDRKIIRGGRNTPYNRSFADLPILNPFVSSSIQILKPIPILPKSESFNSLPTHPESADGPESPKSNFWNTSNKRLVANKSPGGTPWPMAKDDYNDDAHLADSPECGSLDSVTDSKQRDSDSQPSSFLNMSPHGSVSNLNQGMPTPAFVWDQASSDEIIPEDGPREEDIMYHLLLLGNKRGRAMHGGLGAMTSSPSRYSHDDLEVERLKSVYVIPDFKQAARTLAIFQAQKQAQRDSDSARRLFTSQGGSPQHGTSPMARTESAPLIGQLTGMQRDESSSSVSSLGSVSNVDNGTPRKLFGRLGKPLQRSSTSLRLRRKVNMGEIGRDGSGPKRKVTFDLARYEMEDLSPGSPSARMPVKACIKKIEDLYPEGSVTLGEMAKNLLRARHEEQQKFIDILSQGAILKKYSPLGKATDRWFSVSKDGSKISWSRIDPKKRKRAHSLVAFTKTRNLADVLRIRYGSKFSRRFARYNNSGNPPWLCITIVFGDRTLDISCENQEQVTTWFLGLQSLAPLSTWYLSRGMVFWHRARFKIRDQQKKSGTKIDLKDIVDELLHKSILSLVQEQGITVTQWAAKFKTTSHVPLRITKSFADLSCPELPRPQPYASYPTTSVSTKLSRLSSHRGSLGSLTKDLSSTTPEPSFVGAVNDNKSPKRPEIQPLQVDDISNRNQRDESSSPATVRYHKFNLPPPPQLKPAATETSLAEAQLAR
eukprot:g72986.t1